MGKILFEFFILGMLTGQIVFMEYCDRKKCGITLRGYVGDLVILSALLAVPIGIWFSSWGFFFALMLPLAANSYMDSKLDVVIKDSEDRVK